MGIKPNNQYHSRKKKFMTAILNKFTFLFFAIIWLSIPNQGLAQHYLTPDLIQSVKNPSIHLIPGGKGGSKWERSPKGCRIIYGFSEDKNLNSSASQFSWNTYDSTMNISFGHFHSRMSYDVSLYLFDAPQLEDKSSIVFHSVVSPELLKNSFVGILIDDMHRDRDYTDLIFSDDDWLIYMFSNYIINNVRLIISARFVVPENTDMEEIIELARWLDSHIKIEGL